MKTKQETCEECHKKQGFRTIYGKILCDECFRAYLLKALATGISILIITLVIGFFAKGYSLETCGTQIDVNKLQSNGYTETVCSFNPKIYVKP